MKKEIFPAVNPDGMLVIFEAMGKFGNNIDAYNSAVPKNGMAEGADSILAAISFIEKARTLSKEEIEFLKGLEKEASDGTHDYKVYSP